MPDSTPEQLRFHAIDGQTVRADFNGGLLNRLAGAIHDTRHPSYIAHSIEDLLTQRVLQVACGYEDANDSNTLRHDPIFKLGAGRRLLDEAQALAHTSTREPGGYLSPVGGLD
jgi:hypothetical protein